MALFSSTERSGLDMCQEWKRINYLQEHSTDIGLEKEVSVVSQRNR